MARRSKENENTSTEAPEATEGNTESTDAPATEAKVETPINLDAFNTAVGTAFGNRDETTGTVPEADLAAVTSAYRDLDGVKPKNAAKALVGDHLRSAVNELDVIAGKAYMQISEALTAGSGGTKADRPPADPTEALTVRILTLDLARNLVPVPEGADAEKATEQAGQRYSELFDSAGAYLTWSMADEATRGDEPEASSTVKAAVKLALGKSARVGGSGRSGASHDGPRGDIGEHIREAFADKASGDFMSVAEIRNFKSTEYGDRQPSAGAISARLFPTSGKCSLDFVTPSTNEKGNRGATKV
jgi:hypothetical protein